MYQLTASGDPNPLLQVFWDRQRHRAIIHGATVRHGALVGMGAIIMDGAEIGAGAMVGAGALVTPGTHIPPGMLAVGSPAKPVRPLKPEEVAMLEKSAPHYVAIARTYLAAGIGLTTPTAFACLAIVASPEMPPSINRGPRPAESHRNANACSARSRSR